VAAAAVFGLALVVAGVALLTLVRRSLVRQIDEVAEVRAEDIAALVRQGLLPATIAAPDEDSLVQVVDADGRVVAASANARGLRPVGVLRPGGGEAAVRTVDDVPGLGGSYRLLALMETSPEGPRTIYVATSLEPAGETLLLLRVSLLVGGPLLLALVTVMTWRTVGRALQPVEAIRAEAGEISSRDLGRRLPEPATGDEISRLAETMNAMLDRLQAAVTRQRRFVADASHELQTPLAASRTDLEVALTHPDAADWPTTAKDLLEENRHMERLVADLLFVARADDATPLPAPVPIDLHEVVLGEATRLSGWGRIDVDTAAVAGAFVVGRRDDLARAVRNLVDNAQRHAASTVRVELSSEDGVVTLAVEDDGPGVPPEHRERIFERFARLDDARSRETGGTGLGLAIVKDVVERHGGRVAVEQGAVGARFVVTLPSD
jgi:signal transduction histidine kinase